MHFTNSSISAYDTKKDYASPSIKVYYDTIQSRGKVIIILGGGYKVGFREIRKEIPAKLNSSLANNIIKAIDSGLKNFEKEATVKR